MVDGVQPVTHTAMAAMQVAYRIVSRKDATIAPEVRQRRGGRGHLVVAREPETYAPRVLSSSNEARRESQ